MFPTLTFASEESFEIIALYNAVLSLDNWIPIAPRLHTVCRIMLVLFKNYHRKGAYIAISFHNTTEDYIL